jgi:hypothetical protein
MAAITARFIHLPRERERERKREREREREREAHDKSAIDLQSLTTAAKLPSALEPPEDGRTKPDLSVTTSYGLIDIDLSFTDPCAPSYVNAGKKTLATA